MPTYSQARYWILTIKHESFTPFLPLPIRWIRGQLERGEQTGYLHWQCVVICQRKLRLGGIKSIFGDSVHAEPTRSAAAEDYVWKEDTRIDGTQFELGSRPFNRSSTTDWDAIRSSAVSGRLDDVPSDVFVRCYNQLRRIESDYVAPARMERIVHVYHGATGTGKSRRAWNEAGDDCYTKDPRTKFWDGYRGQAHVIIDEFRGAIDIAHILRWLDRYPVRVECKGSTHVLQARVIWITSNLPPSQWYPDLDERSYAALRRRLTNVLEFNI